MAFNPITSWQIHAEPVETVTDFILLGSKITVNIDCSHEIKRSLQDSVPGPLLTDAGLLHRLLSYKGGFRWFLVLK